MTKWKTEKAE